MNKKYYSVAILMFLSGAAADLYAAPESNTAQSPVVKGDQPTPTFKAPYPFTADELWQNILKVADQPEGYVTKEQVSDIFGVKLNLDQEYLKQYKEKVYPLIREKSWYFNMSVGDNNPARSFFYFNWGEIPGQPSAEFPPPPPSGMCINVFKVRPDLPKRGWVLMQEVRGTSEPIYSDTYRKGRIGVLRIEFLPKDNCVRTIRVAASWSEVQQLPVE